MILVFKTATKMKLPIDTEAERVIKTFLVKNHTATMFATKSIFMTTIQNTLLNDNKPPNKDAQMVVMTMNVMTIANGYSFSEDSLKNPKNAIVIKVDPNPIAAGVKKYGSTFRISMTLFVGKASIEITPKIKDTKEVVIPSILVKTYKKRTIPTIIPFVIPNAVQSIFENNIICFKTS